MKRWIIGIFLLLYGMPFVVQADPPVKENTAIEYLIEFVRDSSVIFIRNGDPHDAKEAADHLSQKYSYAKSNLSSADEFIEKVASQSSMSGKLYVARFKDGSERSVKGWLSEELIKYKESK
jgi:hypothetical protein